MIGNTKHTIAVIGHIVRDRIVNPGGQKVDALGGIAYNLTALAAMIVDAGRVIPVCNIGYDLYNQAIEFFSRFPAIDFSKAKKIPRNNKIHELRYSDTDYREEINIGEMPMITPRLFLSCRKLDVALINYIGGDEFPPRHIRWLKRQFSPLIYMDYHSLALGRIKIDKDGQRVKRYFRYNPHWREYVELADIVQMNHIELQSIMPETENETESIISSALKVRERGPMAVIITREEKDIVVIAGNRDKPVAHILPVKPVEKVVDPTGCGDSFAAGFISSYIYSRDILKACNKGLYLAIRKAGFSGLAGFIER
ncbi:MAG: hypothetical protein J7K40_14135 [candidate division Zixibacteria bacterium]|nr:hypothetical protein [candidate division Zixibacteria bacterium]